MVDFGMARKKETEGSLAKVFDRAVVVKKFARYEVELKKMGERLDGLQVNSQASNEEVTAIGAKAHTTLKEIGKEQERILDQPQIRKAIQFVADVKNVVKKLETPLKEIKRAAADKISSYKYQLELERREQEKKAKEEVARLQRELDEEAKKKDVEPIVVTAPVVAEREKVTRTETGSSHQKMKWTFEIEDEEKVPREFLMLDEKKIGQAVGMGTRSIKGVRIFEKPSTAFRG